MRQVLYSQVSTKGQVVIPAELREQMAIESGTQIAFEREGDAIIMRPVTREFIRRLRGYFGKRRPLGPIREREHRKER